MAGIIHAFPLSCSNLLCPSIFLLVQCYTKRSCLRQHSKQSFAVKAARLLWHYCATQMQGFSIFLTAWQTPSNPQSLSLLMLSDKGAHKAREGCSVPSIPGPNYHSEARRVSWPLLGWCHWAHWAEAGSCCRGKTPQRWVCSYGYLQGSEEATRQTKGWDHQTAS